MGVLTFCLTVIISKQWSSYHLSSCGVFFQKNPVLAFVLPCDFVPFCITLYFFKQFLPFPLTTWFFFRRIEFLPFALPCGFFFIRIKFLPFSLPRVFFFPFSVLKQSSYLLPYLVIFLVVMLLAFSLTCNLRFESKNQVLTFLPYHVFFFQKNQVLTILCQLFKFSPFVLLCDFFSKESSYYLFPYHVVCFSKVRIKFYLLLNHVIFFKRIKFLLFPYHLICFSKVSFKFLSNF